MALDRQMIIEGFAIVIVLRLVDEMTICVSMSINNIITSTLHATTTSSVPIIATIK